MLLCSYVGILLLFSPLVLSLLASVVAISFAVVLVFGSLIVNVVDAWHKISSISTEALSSPTDYIEFGIARRRLQLSLYLIIVCSFFPMVYFSGVAGFLTDYIFSIFAVLNFLSKNLFAMLLMEGHLEVLDPVVFQLLAEKEANSSRRAFIRYVFHEVRSPLNSMILGLHVLLDANTKLGPDQKEALVMMKEGTTYMTETLNDILSMQKIEEGVFTMQFAKVDLTMTLKNVVSAYKDLITDKRISFRASIASRMDRYVCADSNLLELVLGNLVSNAVKFSRHGGSIDLEIRAVPAPEISMVSFLIRDTGIGISDDDVKFLFQPYVQLRPGELKAGRGTTHPKMTFFFFLKTVNFDPSFSQALVSVWRFVKVDLI